MKKNLLVLLICLLAASLKAQKLESKKGFVSFFSEAPLENIAAENKAATSVYNLSTGDIFFTVPIKNFQFDKSLMQKHFNNRYMESDKFPKGVFTGVLEGIDLDISGQQEAKAKGKMTIHGVTNEVEIPGIVTINADQVTMESTFMIRLEDYDVKIPSVLWQNIAEEVEVKVSFTFKKG